MALLKDHLPTPWIEPKENKKTTTNLKLDEFKETFKPILIFFFFWIGNKTFIEKN